MLALAMLLTLGQATAPAAIAAPVARADEPPAGSAATVGPFTFETGPYALRALAPESLPYNGSTLVSSCGLTDALGVAMFKHLDGNIYNHPVNQARCALNMMRNYRLDPAPAYLDQAIANANRLVATSVTHRGGTFFPYPFSWNNPNRGRMVPPWFSAMAQGQALSTFVRLHEWTGDPVWLQRAHGVFASFKVPRGDGTPWVVGVEDGRLWLDEYPSTPLDRVFNGHNFGMYGLYDYWRVTGSAEARLLVLGAIHSSWTMVPRLRVLGGISQYCLSQKCLDHRVRNPAYHVTHIGQMRQIHAITGHWHFASTAEALAADRPVPTSGRAVLSSGTHAGYRFDAAGIGTLASSADLPSSTDYRYERRDVPGGAVRPGNGIWLRLVEGPLAGLWVRESMRARPLGFVDRLQFGVDRRVRVEAGRYVGRTYGSDGAVTGSVEAMTGAMVWSYREYARINGAPSILLSSGPLAGAWLTLDTRTLRDTTLFGDVDGSIFRGDIIWLTMKQITAGCAPFRYCPEAAVTREQMASFLVRTLGLPPTTRDYFADDDGRPHEADINALARAGITAGCAADRFCPTRGVTREQMASFLVRAWRLPSTSIDAFSDDEETAHEGDINRLAAAGVTGGCGGTRFCPQATVTRGQMAAFIRRAVTR